MKTKPKPEARTTKGHSLSPMLCGSITAITLIVVLGILAALRMTSFAPGLRLALAATATIWIPGFVLARRLVSLPDSNPMELLALAFVLGLGLLCVESIAAYALHPGMSLVLLLHLLLALALSIFFRRRATDHGEPAGRANRDLWISLALLVPFAALGGAWALHRGPVLGGDTWFHLANIAKLVRGAAIDPGCSWFKDVGADPRYPWPGFHFAAAAVAKLAGVQAQELWVRLPFAVPFLALCSLATLSRRAFGSRRVMWASVTVAVFALPVSVLGLDHVVTYPYPMSFFALGIQPAYLALLAAFLQSRERSLLVPLIICAYAGAAIHILGLIVPVLLLPIIAALLLVAPVGKPVRTAFVWAAVATVLGLVPRLIIQATNYASDGDTGIEQYMVAIRDGLSAVSPDAIAGPWSVIALLASCLAMPFLAKRPGLAVLPALALLAPAYSANPAAATFLAPRMTAYLLRRLYFWPQLSFFGAILLPMVPAAVALLVAPNLPRLARLRQAQVPVSKRRSLDFWRLAVLLLISLALCSGWGFLCRRLILSEPRASVSLAWALVALILLIPAGLGLLRRYPSLERLDSAPSSSGAVLIAFVLLTSLGVTIATRQQVRESLGAQPGRLVSATFPPWEFDEQARFPMFMKPLAQLPARSAVVYCPETWVERMVPGFTAQYVLYGREPGNARTDMARRKHAASQLASLLEPRYPSEEAFALLREYGITHILLSPRGGGGHGALDAYPEIFRPVSNLDGSALYEFAVAADAFEVTSQRQSPAAEGAGPRSPEKLGPDLLKNGDFAVSDKLDGSLPSHWQRLQSTADTVRLAPAAETADGHPAIEIRPHPQGKLWQTLLQELPVPEKVAIYVVGFDGRVVGPGQGRASLLLRKNGNSYERLGTLAFAGDAWRKYSFRAVVPSSGAEALELWLGQANYRDCASVIYYGNVECRRVD